MKKRIFLENRSAKEPITFRNGNENSKITCILFV